MNEGAVVDARRHPRASRRRPSRRWSRATSSSCALTGARYHVAHVSSAESVRAGARGQAARPAGHLRGHAAPPDAHRRGLRALRHARPSASRRCARRPTSRRCARRSPTAPSTRIATDHAPHSPVEKDVEFEQAAFGMIGLETALPLVLELVRAGMLTPAALVDALTVGAGARSSACPAARSPTARRADVTVIDPEAAWTVRRGRACGRARATRRSRPGAARPRRADRRRRYNRLLRRTTDVSHDANPRAAPRAARPRGRHRLPRLRLRRARSTAPARSSSTRRSPATRRSSPTRRTAGRSS